MYTEPSLHYQLNIVKIDAVSTMSLSQAEMDLSLGQVVELVSKKVGKTPHIYLYRTPYNPFNKLDHIKGEATLKKVIQEYQQVCFTHNNTQYIEHMEMQGEDSLNEQCVFVIFDIFQGNYFTQETFKLSTDCKIMFLASMAARYGRHAAVNYYGFRAVLGLFGKDETIRDTLSKFCYPGKRLIISVQHQQSQHLFRTVTRPDLVDSLLYTALRIEEQNRYILVHHQANLRSINELLAIIFQSQMQIVDMKGNLPALNTLQLSSQKQWKLKKKTEERHYLQNTLKNSIFVGANQNYICFVEESYIMHLYSSSPPFKLINSAILNCLPCMHLQQQIPILLDPYLITYEITKSNIILKHYELPSGRLSFTKVDNWYHQIYGSIMCASLDMFGVPIKNKDKARVFYIYYSEDYYDFDCPEKYWDMWVSKRGNNNYSDGSGLFAIYKVWGSNLAVHDFHRKQIKYVFKIDQPQIVIFNQCHNTVAFKTMKQKCLWYQYNYQNGHIKNSIQLESNQQLCFTPNGKAIALSQKFIRIIDKNQTIRLQNCLLSDGSIFFTKDPINQFHTYDYLYIIPQN